MIEYWKCPACKREYPYNGLTIRCICKNGGGKIIVDSSGLACKHRGPAIAEINCGCNGKPKVYECKLGGECILRKLPKMKPEHLQDRILCIDCEMREE